MENNNIGEKIRTLRKNHNETQRFLATALEIERSTLTKIETGERGANIELIAKLAKHYNVSCDYLMDIKKINTTEKEKEIYDIQNKTGLTKEAVEFLKKHKNNSSFQRKLEEYITFLDFIEGGKK
jgi:transcriptional regulator with XRE-family HTH domain